MRNPICPYCNKRSKICTGQDIYPHRPDLRHKVFYRCKPCRAWVGCHPGSSKPLGRLADPELRAAKSAAHAVFDPLWKRKMIRDGVSKNKARSTGYQWLAAQLGISVDDCHIGMFDVETCKRVVQICTRPRPALLPAYQSSSASEPS